MPVNNIWLLADGGCCSASTQPWAGPGPHPSKSNRDPNIYWISTGALGAVGQISPVQPGKSGVNVPIIEFSAAISKCWGRQVATALYGSIGVANCSNRPQLQLQLQSDDWHPFNRCRGCPTTETRERNKETKKQRNKENKDGPQDVKEVNGDWFSLFTFWNALHWYRLWYATLQPNENNQSKPQVNKKKPRRGTHNKSNSWWWLNLCHRQDNCNNSRFHTSHWLKSIESWPSLIDKSHGRNATQHSPTHANKKQKTKKKT